MPGAYRSVPFWWGVRPVLVERPRSPPKYAAVSGNGQMHCTSSSPWSSSANTSWDLWREDVDDDVESERDERVRVRQSTRERASDEQDSRCLGRGLYRH